MENNETLPQAAEASNTPETQVEQSTADIIKAAYEEQVKPDEPASEKTNGERARAADGKFAKADETPSIDKPAPNTVAPAAQPVTAVEQQAQPNTEQQPEPVVQRPPNGWSPASKVAFDALPDAVKADIAKREIEVNQGFAKLSEYKPIEKFVDMAKQSGTTLDRALENYVGMETLLRKDIFSGFESVMRNVGVDPRVMAQAYLNRTGGASQTGASNQSQAPQAAQIDPSAIVSQAVQAMRDEQQNREMQADISKFSSDPKNRFYENVKPAMSQLLSSGLASNLQDAYDKACRLDPTVSPLINQPAAIVNPAAVKANVANQARQAAKATIGSPSSGNPTSKPSQANQDTASIIKAAYEAQLGRA